MNDAVMVQDIFRRHTLRVILLISLTAVLSCYDLFAPPTSVTIWRQTQTAMLTENFVRSGFSFDGLYVNIRGNERLLMAYEYPIYNEVVGILFRAFGNNPFWGKLVSLCATLITVALLYRLVSAVADDTRAFFAVACFVLIPVDVLLLTSFQPDAMGLMFLTCGAYFLVKWTQKQQLRLIAAYSICMLLAGLCKYPLLVPYIPVTVFLYLHPKSSWRIPHPLELLILLGLFIVPFISWYLIREHLTDPTLGQVSGIGAFFLGDLSRFFSSTFYFKPAIMIGMLVTCGTGLFYVLLGLRQASVSEMVLLTGIPLYYIVVPTVSDQYYYLYAIGPIISWFMGKGICAVQEKTLRFGVKFAHYLMLVSVVVFMVFGWNYVLRRDQVILPATKSMRELSMMDDLIFVINMHDRGVGVGGDNPSFEYFAGRKGWNVAPFTPNNIERIVSQIESKRLLGAKWLLVTWYTPELEPWYSRFLPKPFSRAPAFNSEAVASELRYRYPMARSGKNFAILNL